MTTDNISAVVVNPKTGAKHTVSVSATINQSNPPPLGHLLWGAATSGAENIPTAEKTLGKLEANRIFYSGGLPSNYSALNLPQGYTAFVSYKSGGANTVPFAKSCPAGTRIIYHHEPENDYNGNGAQYVSEFVAQYNIVKNANPNVLFGCAAMTYQYAGGRAGQSGTYLPPADHCDFYGCDNYNAKLTGPANQLEHDPQFQNWYNLVKDKGKPLSICEYGVGVNPIGYTTDQWVSQRPDVFAADATWLAKVGGFDTVLYWFYTGAQGDWRWKDAKSSAAWKAMSQ